MSAFASSIALYVSFSSCRTVVFPPPTAMLCGPSPCISSWTRMWVKNRLEGNVLLIGGGEDDLRDRHQRPGEFRILHVLHHDALAALFAHDPLVVRQVERRRLHAMVRIARGVDFADDDDRRRAAERGVSMRRIDPQMVFNVLQLAREPVQLRALPSSRTVMNELEGRLRV